MNFSLTFVFLLVWPLSSHHFLPLIFLTLKLHVFEKGSDGVDSDNDLDEGDIGGVDLGSVDSGDVDPDEVDPDEADPDKFDPKNVDLDAFVTLAAATFPNESFRSSRSKQLCRPLTDGQDVALHDRTVAVLDALAYVSVDERSPAIALGLTLKPLQLVAATNEQIPSDTVIDHLNSICSTLKRLSDAQYCAFSGLNSRSDVNLREMSSELDIDDEKFEPIYNDLFLQIYKHSHARLQTKHTKRWEAFEDFAVSITIGKIE